MIRYANLLRDHQTFTVFWKTVLERISIADAPFFSSIDGSVLRIENENINLVGAAPSDVVDFCRRQWSIPLPCDTWKDIKKEYVKMILLRDYLNRCGAVAQFMHLQMLISDKVIGGEDIQIEDGRIVEIRGWGNLG